MSQPATPPRYPEVPDVPGALPRARLAEVASSRFAVWQNPADHDLLAAAITLNSKPSVGLALSVGAPMEVRDEASLLYVVISTFHDHRTQEEIAQGIGGSSQECVEWLDFLVDHARFPANHLDKAAPILLTEAVRFGNIPALDWLVSRGVSLDIHSPQHPDGSLLIQAAKLPMAGAALDWLLPRLPGQINAPDGDGMTPLLAAVDAWHEDVVNKLLACGADMGASTIRQQNALHFASSAIMPDERRADFVHTILSQVPPHLLPVLKSQPDTRGYLPIHEAAMDSFGVDWKALAPDGDVDRFSPVGVHMGDGDDALMVDQVSPLGIAFAMGNTKGAKELIDSGARLDRLSASGHTGWHFLTGLSMGGSTRDRHALRDLSKLLLRAGISPEQTTDNGIHPRAFTCSPPFDDFLVRIRQRALSKMVSAKPVSSPVPRRPPGL